jgi:hypothetical protein
MRYVLLSTILFPSLLLIQLSQTSAALVCAKLASPVANEDLKYKLRGNRCEGLFMQSVAASSHIRIIGYHRHDPVFPEKSKDPIPILVARLHAPATEAVTSQVDLHVVSTRFRQYYRMDALVSPGALFPWDRTLLADQQIELKPDELAAIACAPCDDSNLRLLAVSVGEDKTAPKQSLDVVFISSVDISNLKIHLVTPRGETVEKKVPLGGPVLLAQMPLHFALGEFVHVGGEYRMMVIATPRYPESAMGDFQARIDVPE